MTSEKSCWGYALLGLGVFFLLANILGFSIGGVFLVLLFLIPGGIMLQAGMNNNPTPFLVIPGLMLITTGSIFAFCFLTNHWEAWAYAWALYPVSLGVAFSHIGQYQPNFTVIGQNFLRVGLVVFVTMAFFFEILIFQSLGALGIWLVALAMIGMGILLLRQETGNITKAKAKRKQMTDDPDQIRIY